MISKSQFVIFSALLAYQGMVGAPDSSKVTQNPKGAVPAKKQPTLEEQQAAFEEILGRVDASHDEAADAEGKINEHAKLTKELAEKQTALEAAIKAKEVEERAVIRDKIMKLRNQAGFAAGELQLKIEIAHKAAADAMSKYEALGIARAKYEAQAIRHAKICEEIQAKLPAVGSQGQHDALMIQRDHSEELLYSAQEDFDHASEQVREAAAAAAAAEAAVLEQEKIVKGLEADLKDPLRFKLPGAAKDPEQESVLNEILKEIKEDEEAAKKKATAEAAAKKATAEAAAKKAADEAAAKKADDEAAAKNAAPKQAAAVAPKQAAAVAPKKDDEAAAKAAAEEAAKKVPTTTTPAAPAVATTEFKTFTAAEAAPIAKKLAEKIFAGDNAKILEAEKKITKILMLGERLKKAEEKAAPKKQEKTEKKSDKPKKLRRLGEEDKKAAAEKTPDHIDNVIATALKQARHILAQLQQIHGAQLQNVNNQADFTKLEADAKQAGEAISKAEAVIKLREDNTAKADDLKKAKATVLGLGLGLGLGIPVLAAVVFTVLVKTNRVLLNFGSSATVSADV